MRSDLAATLALIPAVFANSTPFATLVDNNSGDRLTLCPGSSPNTIVYQLESVAGNPLNDVHFVFGGDAPAAGAVDAVVMPAGDRAESDYVVNNVHPATGRNGSMWTFRPATTNTYFIVGPGLTLSARTTYLKVIRTMTSAGTQTFEVIANCDSSQ